ncbi:set1/Ash2 histone methyltransferase complex subunit ASH2-like isoform X1 [Gordionus sp. m RMFG-2023]|uniref:set1/Ash2 histone methyltransferase complex subunit ASH2-like isoform X1 n=3 Tax=Gordionus sp. m RMFG-2023 TaxID=3053472 RepID=UPI0031FDECDC
MTNYIFICKECETDNKENLFRKSATMLQILITTIGNLRYLEIIKKSNKKYFSKEKEIIPFIEGNLEALSITTQKYLNWKDYIDKILMSETDIFSRVINDDLEFSMDEHYGLKEEDLLKIGPVYDTISRSIFFRSLSTVETESMCDTSTDIISLLNSNDGSLDPGRVNPSNKRKASSIDSSDFNGFFDDKNVNNGELKDPVHIDNVQQMFGNIANKRNKIEPTITSTLTFSNVSSVVSNVTNIVSTPNFANYGSYNPTEYPFNKDGYRYILAEPDPNAPYASQFHSEESGWLAGKPIPPFLYRTFVPPHVTLSLNDRAHQLKVNDNRLIVTGEKGYSMIRATHGINHGTWYFECKIVEMSENTAARIGWAQPYANLQAPLGYDKFGYSCRSKHGTLFHQSKGVHFNNSASYNVGDVIGCYIHLPSLIYTSKLNAKTTHLKENDKELLSPGGHSLIDDSCKINPLVKFKGFFYFEQKDEIEAQLKKMKSLPGSIIAFYKNGRLVEKKDISKESLSYGDYSHNNQFSNNHREFKIHASEEEINQSNTLNDSKIQVYTAFDNVFQGTYHPAISIYFNSVVSFNPGPQFEYPPSIFPCNMKALPVSDLVSYCSAQQALNDILYFVCNRDKLKI